MKNGKRLLIAFALVVLGFILGRTDLLERAEPLAAAQARQEKGEMTGEEEMQAMIQAGMPGDHHKHLDRMLGKWKGTFQFSMNPGEPPMKSVGTATREWILDGRYILETMEGEADFGPFKGMGFIGYNNLDGRYEVAWVDNMSTAIYREIGYYDPQKKILYTYGAHKDPGTGHVRNARSQMDLSNPDRHVATGYMFDENGQEFKFFQGVMERVEK